jgi:precorrin-6A/cobalt-precorrin-6A reductase
MIVNHGSAMPKVLVLGGTTEATTLAQVLAQQAIPAILSYAGRVAQPRAQPLPVRMGGFGGIDGLTAYLRDNAITHLIDATHPFAATISHNALAACARTGTPCLALTRPPWEAQPGDKWTNLPDLNAVIAALDGPPQRIFLAIGRQHIDRFATQPQHHYLLRMVDAPDTAPPLPNHTLILDRGPFTLANDTAMLRTHHIQHIIAKNAGGTGARAKLDAARGLGLTVTMIARPKLPPRSETQSITETLDWLTR